MRRQAIASGAGFEIGHFVCTAGPEDRPFEEQHRASVVALVLEGTFRYRARAGVAELVPGALLLGNAHGAYECSHAHGRGDRCLSFVLSPELLEDVVRVVAPRRRKLVHARPAVPAHPRRAALLARARAALLAPDAPMVSLEELAHDVAAAALADEDTAPTTSFHSVDARRAAHAARLIETRATLAPLPLAELAAHVRLSPFHLLRTFRRVLGVTPHQYQVGVRVARAAELLLASDEDVTAIAYESGFGDLSHFIRTFRGATGRSPRAFRRALRR